MNRRSMLVSLVAAFLSNAKKGNSQADGYPIAINPKFQETIALMLDIETLKSQVEGKVYALVIKYNDRKVCFTPDELMDIVEGKD